MGRSRPDGGVWAQNGSMGFGMIGNGELPNVSSSKRGGAWGRGKEFENTQVNA